MAPMPGHIKFTSPFAPLQLTPADVEMLDQLSRVILRNYVAQYEEFERSGGESGMDKRAWRFVKQKENVRAFVQRKDRNDGGTAEIARSVERYSTVGSGLVAPPDLPVIQVVGSIPGTLDDLMYGLMASNMRAVRVRTSYIDDFMGDGAVLATLQEPTVEAPLDSHVVRWVHNEMGHGVLRPVVNDRDFVYFERTGIAYTSSGERIGFHLLHSAHFPQTHELPGLIRGTTSVCGIYRDNPQQHQAELYVRTIVDVRGSMIRPVVVVAVTDTFVSVAKYIESSYRKKLAWLLRQRQRKSSGSTASERRRHEELGSCAMCNKPPSRTRTMLSSDPFKRQCALCDRYVCSSCRIKKTVSHAASATGKLLQRKFTFCCVCYGDACRMSALEISRQEVAAMVQSTTGSSTRSGAAWSDCASTISSERPRTTSCSSSQC